MFNLEESISEWRRQMQSVGAKNPDIVDELESHLREDLAARVQAGEREEQAFASAVQGVGQPSLLQQEFAKLGGKKWAWPWKLKGIIGRAFDPVPSLSTFTPSARRTLELARQEAPRLQHGFIGTEHVLLGLLGLEEGTVPNVFQKLGVDRAGLKQRVEDWVSRFPASKKPGTLPYTPRVRKSLRLAAQEAKISQSACVEAEHIFLGLLLEADGVAGQVLRSLGLSPETTREEITREQGRNRGGTDRDEHWEDRLCFLRKASTEQMPHSEVGLFDHLLGTRRLLVEWGARPALCDAGLFHSIYSTDCYELKAVPLSMREEVRQLIGDDAESLVWLFCMMRRETLYQNLHQGRGLSVQHRLTGEWIPLTEAQFQDLITLSYANCLEAFPRCSWLVRRNIRSGLRHFRKHAIGSAQSALDRIDTRWWEIWK